MNTVAGPSRPAPPTESAAPHEQAPNLEGANESTDDSSDFQCITLSGSSSEDSVTLLSELTPTPRDSPESPPPEERGPCGNVDDIDDDCVSILTSSSSSLSVVETCMVLQPLPPPPEESPESPPPHEQGSHYTLQD
jgi:hypothetical protein